MLPIHAFFFEENLESCHLEFPRKIFAAFLMNTSVYVFVTSAFLWRCRLYMTKAT